MINKLKQIPTEKRTISRMDMSLDTNERSVGDSSHTDHSDSDQSK